MIKVNRKKNWIAIALIIMMLLMTACGTKSESVASNGTPTEQPAQNTSMGDVFKVALNAEPPNVDPHNNTRLTSWAVQEEIFDKLVTKDADGNILPDVAESWELVNDTTMRFHLREDVFFHNGTQLTAEDVVFSFQRAIISDGSKTFFSIFDSENIAVVDQFTVDVATKTPFAAILNYLSSPRGAILCKAAVEEMGDEAYGRNPVGSGPFILTSWVTGDNITLSINEKYWGEMPNYSTLTFKFITEAANRTIELETGGVDAIYSVSASDVSRIESNPDLKLISGPGYKMVYVSLNMVDPVTKNQKVRQALVTALDIPAIVSTVYGDTAVISDSYMSPNILAYQAQTSKEYNVEKAKQLLAEAGYPNGLNLTIKLAEDNDYIAMSEIIQNMWSKIGVTAEIQIMEQATYIEQANVGEVQVGITAVTAPTGDPDNALMIWRSTAINQTQPDDPEIDIYLDKGAAEFDVEKRAVVYSELQKYLWDKDYGIPIAFPNIIYATSNKVENFECNPGSTPDLAKVIIRQ